MVTLRHLEIFRAVCVSESITVASEKLLMTQPAVSLAIKELESFYGVRLFDRMNRRIYITDAGARLLCYADDILSQVEETVRAVGDASAEGRLRVGVNVTLGETILPAVLDCYEREHPHLSVSAVIENSAQIIGLLQKNEIDLALVDNVTVSPTLVTEILARERMAVVCAPNYGCGATITLAELAGERLLLRERGSGTRASVDSVFRFAGFDLVPIIESVSTSSLIPLVKSGLGITILSRSLIRSELEAGELKELRVKGVGFPRSYFIVHHKNKLLTPAMQSFSKLVKEKCHTFFEENV